MITVTGDYKTQAKGNYKEVFGIVSDGIETINGTNDLKSIKILSSGGLCRTVLRQAEIKVWGTYDWLDKEINLQIGIEVDGSPEYVDHGDFSVVEVSEDKSNDERTLKCYDLMYESLVEYVEIDGGDYPLTMLELLQSICTTLGWTLATTSFVHDDLSITSELFSNQGLRYRDILEDIAEASGTTMYFDGDNELVLRTIDTDTVLETLTTNDEISLTLKESWGELNSLALAREPQEDVILEKDDASITANGKWELRIINNLILDGDRETYIGDLFTTLKGVEYRSFECETVGLGYFEIGDTIKVTDKADVEYTVLITDIEIKLEGGLKETIKGGIPSKSSSDFDTAGIIGQRILNTEIIVDKQAGEITSIVSDTTEMKQTAESITVLAQSAKDQSDENEDGITDVRDDVTSLEVRADGLEIDVGKAGGSNLLKNAVGLKGSIDKWILPIEDLAGIVLEDFTGSSMPTGWWGWNGSTGIVFDGDVTMTTGSSGYNSVGMTTDIYSGYSLKDSAISIKITDMTFDTGYANLEVIFMQAGYPVTNSLNIAMNETLITSGSNSGGGWTTAGYISRTAEQYLRIRESEGTIYFEASADNSTWVTVSQVDYTVDISSIIMLQPWIWDQDSAGEATFDDLTYWGLNDANNGGTLLSEIDMETLGLSSESQSGVEIDGQYIEQSFATVIGEVYTLYMRFVKYGTIDITITGQDDQTLTVTDYSDGDADVYKYEFTATSTETTLRISGDTELTDYAYMTDIVVKRGDCNGWELGFGEVFGNNFSFDEDGFSITSTSDNYKSILDNKKLAVYDTTNGSKNIMFISNEEGKISDLIVQDELSIRRYENTAKTVRFIATDTGVMITVNN